eukprot:TRINITY_DN34824_c0_g1_i1.p1 TRINITY_DN34824_c0_g1~~TRINITY_DN34824_c0_g1_i1.p1  ORF type:complete len:579 (+),score=110.99 TRINITY_DN34824_c0_g1_i1:30-1739(+)
MGGGKTRALEEMRYELLDMDRVLPLAYTYNGEMELETAVEFGWSASYKANYAMTAVARMAAVFYGVSLPEMCKRLGARNWADLTDMAAYDYPIHLIRGFIAHAIGKLREHGKEVKTVVILVDEVARAEIIFGKKYGLQSGVDGDVTSVLRSAVLDGPILEGLNATLVISSLALSPLGVTTSSRSPTVLELGSLDSENVTKQWWRRDDPEFKLVAAALADTPRFLEYAAAFIGQLPEETVVNERLIKELFQYVRQQIPTRLETQLPEAMELYTAFFAEIMARNEIVMDRIQKGIFVNSLTAAEMVQTEVAPQITPIPSLFALSAAAKGTTPSSDFAELLGEFPEAIALKEEGRPLEWCARWWLRVRLATAAGRRNFPLEKLLGVEGAKFDAATVKTPMRKALRAVRFDVPSTFNDVRTQLPTGRITQSYNNKAQFFQDLADVGVSFTEEVLLLESAKREAWDLLLAVFDATANKWFLAFIDMKAKGAFDDSTQAEHVRSLFDEAQKREDVAASSLLQAFKEGRYCYVYLTTADGESSASETAISLRRSDTSRWFGPLARVHDAIREALRK